MHPTYNVPSQCRFTDFEVPKNFRRLGYIRYFIGIEIKVGSDWSITRI